MKKLRDRPFFRVAKGFLPWAVAGVILGAGFGILGDDRQPAQASVSSYDNLRTFAEVLALIQSFYVEEKTTKELATGAIKGLLRTLDPHSSYMDVSTYKNRQEETEGKFGGLGIEITLMDSYVTIVSPIEDTPAERKGLKSGDQIIKIEEQSTKNMDLYMAVKLMRGKIGTDVTLTIFRESSTKTFDVTITRAMIKIRSVKYKMIDKTIGYVRVSSFSQATTRELNSALSDMKNKGMKRIVLDLRNNPGGLLKQAVDVSDLFVGKGHTIVSTRGRTPDQNSQFFSNSWGDYADMPMVVIINAGSASASEIVAGAMQDLERAVVVGDRSFGKGSVQTIRRLSDGSGLSLTTARYFTPSGKMIHGIGIEPDVLVKLELKDDDGEDVDLPEPIREKDLIENFNGKDNFSEKLKKNGNIKQRKRTKEDLKKARKIFNLEKDNQLRRAIEVLRAVSGSKVTKLQFQS